MLKYLILIFLAIISLLFISSCILKTDDIQKTTWKYRDGHYSGDVLEINKIRDDTIWLKSGAKVLLSRAYKRFYGRKILELKSTNGIAGTYVEIY